MLNFKKLTIEDIDLLNSYYQKYNNKCADYTVCGYFLWRDYFNTHFAISNDTLILKMDSKSWTNFFGMPLGENVENAISELIDYCKIENINLKIFPVPKFDIDKIKLDYNFDVKYIDRCSDYIYNYESLKSLSGRKLHGQKNHLNYFIKNYPEAVFSKIENSDIDNLIQFLTDLKNKENINSDFHNIEFAMNEEMLKNIMIYKFVGYKLTIDNKIIGFIVGEQIKNTIFIHFQKMDRTYRGSYQYLMVEFLKTFENAELVNMEDDAEDDDLKYTKECYHPIYMLDKYMIFAK